MNTKRKQKKEPTKQRSRSTASQSERYVFRQFWIGPDFIPHERGMDCCIDMESDDTLMLRALSSTSGMNSVLVSKSNLGKIFFEMYEKGLSASIFHKAGAMDYYAAKEALVLTLKGALKEYQDRVSSSTKMFKIAIDHMERGNVGNPIPFKFKVGEIVRTGSGSTALIRITDIHPDHGGKNQHRYYGMHILGSYAGAYEDQLTKATKEDLKMWRDKYA